MLEFGLEGEWVDPGEEGDDEDDDDEFELLSDSEF